MGNNIDIKVFDNEQFGKVRVVEQDGEPWFVAADVCKAFGVANSRNVVSRLEDDEKGVHIVDTLGGAQKVSIVSESGLYHMLFTMEPKNARGTQEEEVKHRIDKLRTFKRWITHEVIPSIRKNGGYIANQENLTPAEIVANALIVAQNIIDEQKRKLSEQEPFVAFANHVGDSSDLIDMGRMAKLAQDEHIDLGRNKLFAWLRGKGYLMANNMPYQRYVDQGIFDVKEGYKETAYGTKLFQTTYVTGKGQIYLIEKLREAFAH